jgi:hypothetical protein
MKTTYILGIVTAIELISTQEMAGSIVLWALYGIYRLLIEE